MLDDNATVVICEIDETDPSRIAIGIHDNTEDHVFYLPLTSAKCMVDQILELVYISESLKSWAGKPTD